MRVFQNSWRQNTTLCCFYLSVVVLRQHASVSGMTYANATSTKLLKCQNQSDPHHWAYIRKRTKYNMRTNISKYNNAVMSWVICQNRHINEELLDNYKSKIVDVTI